MERDVVYPTREYRLAAALNSLQATGKAMRDERSDPCPARLTEADFTPFMDENRVLTVPARPLASQLGFPYPEMREAMDRLGIRLKRETGFVWTRRNTDLLKSYADENGRLRLSSGVIARKMKCSQSYILLKSNELGLVLQRSKAQTVLTGLTAEAAE